MVLNWVRRSMSVHEVWRMLTAGRIYQPLQVSHAQSCTKTVHMYTHNPCCISAIIITECKELKPVLCDLSKAYSITWQNLYCVCTLLLAFSLLNLSWLWTNYILLHFLKLNMIKGWRPLKHTLCKHSPTCSMSVVSCSPVLSFACEFSNHTHVLGASLHKIKTAQQPHP